MITNDHLSKFSPDERSAWIDSLSEDESAILYCPIAHRYTLVFISLVKQLLAEEDLPAHYRLKYLEWLDKRNEPWESPQIISAVEPMCAEGYQLLRETMNSLRRPRWRVSFCVTRKSSCAKRPTAGM